MTANTIARTKRLIYSKNIKYDGKMTERIVKMELSNQKNVKEKTMIKK